MFKILTVLGTRPEAIKLAPVIKTLEKRKDRFDPVVCVTSQHREMLDQVLQVFDLKPRYDLNVMKPGQSLAHVTNEILKRIEEILVSEKPDLVLVQGDTTTTFAASLAAFYLKIKVGHVEAGLRTFDKYQPFPEEVNRRLTTVLADFHFAPTTGAKENLVREGIKAEDVIVTGNTGIDALFMTLARLKANPQNNRMLEEILPNSDGKRLVLITAHRRENFGLNFEEICKAVVKIVDKNRDVIVCYPVHLNPNIQIPANKFLKGHERIKLVEPLEYAPFVQLLEKSYLILTDSGGIQEEAPSLGKPVLVMRNTTERPEAVKVGTAKLVGTNAERIAEEVQVLLDDPAKYQKMSKVKNPFGDGKASERIIEHILNRCYKSGEK